MRKFKKGQKVLEITSDGIVAGGKVEFQTKDGLKVVSPGKVSTMSGFFTDSYVADTAHNRSVALMYQESVNLSKKQLEHIKTLFK